jgi:mono/diheme cytochrome c family protein
LRWQRPAAAAGRRASRPCTWSATCTTSRSTGRRPRAPSSTTETPPPVLARGAERFKIYCAPCHDQRGEGKGILAAQGLPTTSLHIDRLKAADDGYIFGVITEGRGLMPSYRWPIPPADRWAIIAHVRELQREDQQAQQGAAQ